MTDDGAGRNAPTSAKRTLRRLFDAATVYAPAVSDAMKSSCCARRCELSESRRLTAAAPKKSGPTLAQSPHRGLSDEADGVPRHLSHVAVQAADALDATHRQHGSVALLPAGGWVQ